MADEFFFDSTDAALKRFPDELWAAKGKPRLWVKLYESDGIIVWRDIGYGWLRLKTPRGVGEGKDTVSVGGTFVICRDQKIEVYVKDSQEFSPEEDTLELDLEAEFLFPESGEGMEFLEKDKKKAS